MVIELVSGSNGPFSNPDWDHCVVFLGTGYLTLKVPLSVNCILGDVARLTKFHLSDHGRKLGELSDLICFRYLAFRCIYFRELSQLWFSIFSLSIPKTRSMKEDPDTF